MPKEFSNFPIFYTNDERKWLEGSPIQNAISEKVRDMKHDYELICKEVPDFAQFSFKEFSECRMIVSSRIFGIDIHGTKTDAYVAYADMLNHRRPR